MSEVTFLKEVNDTNFKEEVLDQDGPTLVKFEADFCGPCKMMQVTLDQMFKKEVNDPENALLTKFQGAKVDVTKAVETTPQYAVKGIPTLMVIYKGKVIGLPKVGAMQEGQITEALSTWLAKIEEQEAEEKDEEVVDLSDEEL